MTDKTAQSLAHGPPAWPGGCLLAALPLALAIVLLLALSVLLQQPTQQLPYATAIKTALVVASLICLSLSLALAIQAHLAASRRLKLLVKNASALARSVALPQTIGGQDEIGEVDATLHTMSRTLKEAGEKQRAILEHASDVICSFELSGRCIAMNPASRRLWGYDPEELIGKDIFEVIVPADRQRLSGHLRSVFSKEIPREYELKTTGKDGTIKDTLWSLHWSVEYGWIIGVVHDITARKAAERLQSEFTAMVTHDLRSPLSTISVFISMIEEQVYGPVPDQLKDAAVEMQQLLPRLINLVDEILYFERLQARELPLALKDVSLSSIIANSVHAVSGTAKHNDVKISVEPVNSSLQGDSLRLTQVLSNLLANAIKYSPRGETVTVSVSEDQSGLTVQVEDKGPGVPDDQKAVIFEKFKQGASADTKEGTGLGLAICKQLIEQHGGRIGVSNTPGGGSTFWFRLPRAARATPQHQSQGRRV